MVYAGGKDPGSYEDISESLGGFILIMSQGVLEDVDSKVFDNVLSFVKESSPQM